MISISHLFTYKSLLGGRGNCGHFCRFKKYWLNILETERNTKKDSYYALGYSFICSFTHPVCTYSMFIACEQESFETLGKTVNKLAKVMLLWNLTF